MSLVISVRNQFPLSDSQSILYCAIALNISFSVASRHDWVPKAQPMERFRLSCWRIVKLSNLLVQPKLERVNIQLTLPYAMDGVIWLAILKESTHSCASHMPQVVFTIYVLSFWSWSQAGIAVYSCIIYSCEEFSRAILWIDSETYCDCCNCVFDIWDNGVESFASIAQITW